MLDANALAAKSNSDLRWSVVALGTHDGHVAWQHRLETPSPADSTTASLRPLEQDGLVYASYYYTDQQTQPYHGVVETLDPATGTTRWRREVATEIVSEPVVSGSRVYVTAWVSQGLQYTESYLVEALDSQTGTVRWQRALTGRPSLPVVANGQVFVLASQQAGGHVLAFSASDGSVMWDHTFNAGLIIGDDTTNGGPDALLVHNDLVYVQASTRDASGVANLALFALRTHDGSVAWRYQLGQGHTLAPAINESGDTLCVSTYVAPIGRGTSMVVGLGALNGQVRWRVSTVILPSGCSPQGDAFYLTDGAAGQPGVLALNSQDGRQLWRTSAASQVAADAWRGPTVTQGFVGVYLIEPGTTSTPVRGRLAVLRTSDGKLLWQGDFAGEAGSRMDIEGDQIYNPEIAAGLPTTVVYALDSGSRLWSYRFGQL
jgi:outer membrane protein assembly factor BamB